MVALPYIVRYIVTMEYTKERQDSDRSFLVGVSYGRESERERIKTQIRALADHYEKKMGWNGVSLSLHELMEGL